MSLIIIAKSLAGAVSDTWRSPHLEKSGASTVNLRGRAFLGFEYLSLESVQHTVVYKY